MITKTKKKTSREKIARTEDTAAENLYKSPSFQWRVAMKVALICGALVIVGGLLTNWWLARRFTNYVETTNADVSNRIFTAKQEVTNQIAAEFESVRIKGIVSDVASNRASVLLDSQIWPEIVKFRSSITNQLSATELALKRLDTNSTFAELVLAAETGDRKAWDLRF